MLNRVNDYSFAKKARVKAKHYWIDESWMLSENGG